MVRPRSSRRDVHERHSKLTVRMGGTSTCCMPFFACIEALILAAAAAVKRSVTHLTAEIISGDSLPAAAAGSRPGVLLSSRPGLKDELLAKGLRLLLTSGCLPEGERERRSKREERLTSGSVWSKRDRLDVRRSSSAMI